MFCSFFQLTERNATFIYAKKIHTEKLFLKKELEFYLYGIIIKYFSERKREKIGCSPWWDPSLADGACRSPSPLCPLQGGVGPERTAICGRSLWAPVDLKKQQYWYLLWKKKKVKPVYAPIGLVRHCSCFSALLSSGCAALKQIEKVGWWHSIRPPATPSHLDQSRQRGQVAGGKDGCWWVSMGARAQSPGSIPPPPDPHDYREEVHPGRSRALVHLVGGLRREATKLGSFLHHGRELYTCVPSSNVGF